MSVMKERLRAPLRREIQLIGVLITDQNRTAEDVNLHGSFTSKHSPIDTSSLPLPPQLQPQPSGLKIQIYPLLLVTTSTCLGINKLALNRVRQLRKLGCHIDSLETWNRDGVKD